MERHVKCPLCETVVMAIRLLGQQTTNVQTTCGNCSCYFTVVIPPDYEKKMKEKKQDEYLQAAGYHARR